MNEHHDLVTRKVEPLIMEALGDTRVVTINGARQAGKSTLARLAAATATNPVIRLLDDPATLRSAQDDPTGFIDHDGLLARQLSWNEQRAHLFHYRTKDKIEVDAVLESADGRVVGIEVKAGSTVRTNDLAGLRHLANRLGPRFIAGYLLYTGQQTLPFGDRLCALPIDALWRTAP
ncbi:MAG: DUF4143 domain-containing protein [Pseudonocardiaceae bacterium]